MNRADLIAAVADETGLSKNQVNNVISAALDTIVDTLSKGENVKLVGFGVFHSVERKGRTGVNPRTLEPVQIAQTTVPRFKPSKQMKDAVK